MIYMYIMINTMIIDMMLHITIITPNIIRLSSPVIFEDIYLSL